MLPSIPLRYALSSCAALHFALGATSSAAEFKFPNQTLTVPDGFEVEIAADSSVVPRPIGGAFDEQGRLYVTDSSGQSDKAEKQLQTKSHRVLLLTDTKGTGRFDKSSVFADGLMFPEGCMWSNGALYVAAVPQIWKLSGMDANGAATKREVWFDGKTITGCANDLHGPYLGLDGWIYWCKGAFAQQTYERPGKRPFVTRASHIFRARPDGSGIEPVMTGGMDNPVGVAFNANGERFLTATFLQNPALGRRDGVIHAIYGGVYGKVHDVIDEHPQTGGLLPPLIHLGAAAPCGIAAYRSQVFGPEFSDNLFVCCFNLHKVTRHVLLPEGATYRTLDSDFVTSDSPDFHPTAVIEDADGSLLVFDTGGWYKMCCPTSQLSKPDVLGAIYRVRRKGAAKVADPRGLEIAWESLQPAGLAALLADPRPAVRDRAMDALGKKGAGAVEAIRDLIQKSASGDSSPLATATRREAVWALTHIDAPSARQAVRELLGDSSTEVRHAAIHSVSVWRDTAARDALVDILAQDDPQLRRVAAEALGRLGDSRVVFNLLAAAGAAGDRVGEHSAIYAVIEIGNPAALRLGLHSSVPEIRRAALISLDQMHSLNSGEVTPLLDSTEPILKDTAGWIISHHADWGKSLAGYFRGRLQSISGSEKADSDLAALIAGLSSSPAIQELLADTLHNAAPAAQLTALEAMRGAGLKETPAQWFAQLSALVTANGGSAPLPAELSPLLRPALAAIRSLSMPKSPPVDLVSTLIATGSATHLPDDLRVEALAAIPGGLPHPDPELVRFLCAHLSSAQPLTVRTAAAGVLAKSHLDADALAQITAVLPGVGPLELPKLLPAFEQAPGEKVGLQLVAALQKSAPGLRADALKPLLAKFPPAVQQAAQPLLARLNSESAGQTAHLDELAAALTKGDVRHGQAIFLRTGCTVCHSMGYLGGKLGPDLTRIGGIRTERDLLEAIVYPSASFVRSYEPMIATTRTGDQITGILRKDAPDEIILATGPETEQRLARADIRDIQPGSVSLMPQGFEQALSHQDLADLIAFLKAAK